MTNSATPTLVLVHGAWHGAWCFAKLIDELTALGIATVAPDLPGHGADTNALGDLDVDAARVRETVASIDGPVVLMGHSYGGLVISEAASDAATAAKVERLVYLCAIVAAPKTTFFGVPADHSRSLLGPLITVREDGLSTIDTSDLAAAKAAFYADCSDEDSLNAAAHLCAQPMGNMGLPVSGDPLATIAGTYIRCTADRTIPIEVQDALIASASVAAKAFDTLTLDASHSPFLSQPKALAAQLASLVRR